MKAIEKVIRNMVDSKSYNSFNLEEYFTSYRENIVGIEQHFESPYGRKK